MVLKSRGRQSDAFSTTFQQTIRIYRCYYNQRCQCADHHRIDKRFQQGHQAFRCRLIRFHSRVRDGRRTNTRFIGKQRPLKSNNNSADHTAGSTLHTECITDYQHNRGGNMLRTHTDDDQCAQYIKHSHKRHNM